MPPPFNRARNQIRCNHGVLQQAAAHASTTQRYRSAKKHNTIEQITELAIKQITELANLTNPPEGFLRATILTDKEHKTFVKNIESLNSSCSDFMAKLREMWYTFTRDQQQKLERLEQYFAQATLNAQIVLVLAMMNNNALKQNYDRLIHKFVAKQIFDANNVDAYVFLSTFRNEIINTAKDISVVTVGGLYDPTDVGAAGWTGAFLQQLSIGLQSRAPVVEKLRPELAKLSQTLVALRKKSEEMRYLIDDYDTHARKLEDMKNEIVDSALEKVLKLSSIVNVLKNALLAAPVPREFIVIVFMLCTTLVSFGYSRSKLTEIMQQTKLFETAFEQSTGQDQTASQIRKAMSDFNEATRTSAFTLPVNLLYDVPAIVRGFTVTKEYRVLKDEYSTEQGYSAGEEIERYATEEEAVTKMIETDEPTILETPAGKFTLDRSRNLEQWPPLQSRVSNIVASGADFVGGIANSANLLEGGANILAKGADTARSVLEKVRRQYTEPTPDALPSSPPAPAQSAPEPAPPPRPPAVAPLAPLDAPSSVAGGGEGDKSPPLPPVPSSPSAPAQSAPEPAPPPRPSPAPLALDASPPGVAGSGEGDESPLPPASSAVPQPHLLFERSSSSFEREGTHKAAQEERESAASDVADALQENNNTKDVNSALEKSAHQAKENASKIAQLIQNSYDHSLHGNQDLQPFAKHTDPKSYSLLQGLCEFEASVPDLDDATYGTEAKRKVHNYLSSKVAPGKLYETALQFQTLGMLPKEASDLMGPNFSRGYKDTKDKLCKSFFAKLQDTALEKTKDAFIAHPITATGLALYALPAAATAATTAATAAALAVASYALPVAAVAAGAALVASDRTREKLINVGDMAGNTSKLAIAGQFAMNAGDAAAHLSSDIAQAAGRRVFNYVAEGRACNNAGQLYVRKYDSGKKETMCDGLYNPETPEQNEQNCNKMHGTLGTGIDRAVTCDIHV